MLPRPLKQQFVDAVRRMLCPVVRQLIAYGISYPAFSQLVKEVYVDVGEHEFPLPFKRQTDSRLALVTGISRKEIPPLRARSRDRGAPAEVEDTVVTHVIGRWMSAAPYVDADGRPRPLPYESDRRKAPGFSRLVRDLGVDIPVRSVLDELLRVGAVELLANGDVVLRREAHVPAGDAEGKLTLLGSDPAEVFSTIVHNIEHPDTPRFQRKVVYDNIGSEALPELRATAQDLGGEYIRQANSLLAARDRDRNPDAPGGRRSRVVLGAYYFEEELPSEAEPPPAPAKHDKAAPPGRIRRAR